MLTIAWWLLAQTFSPEMPPGVPPATGPVAERAVLRSLEIREGTGAAAKPGQEYTVHYTGWLRNGTKFDSSVDRNQPFQFIQGRRHVIAGWESGFEGMRVGGQRRLFVPYPLAYGEAGRGAIPPKAELVFDIELLAVRDVEPEVATRGWLVALADNQQKLIALARAIPEEKYTWRPSPDARPVGEVLAHVALGLRLMLDLAERFPEEAALRARVEEQRRQERAPHSKAELLTLLDESFALARQKLEPLRPAQLAREVTFFGTKTNAGGVYVQTVSHVAEHLGQLIAYARMQGIVPPWSAAQR